MNQGRGPREGLELDNRCSDWRFENTQLEIGAGASELRVCLRAQRCPWLPKAYQQFAVVGRWHCLRRRRGGGRSPAPDFPAATNLDFSHAAVRRERLAVIAELLRPVYTTGAGRVAGVELVWNYVPCV